METQQNQIPEKKEKINQTKTSSNRNRLIGKNRHMKNNIPEQFKATTAASNDKSDSCYEASDEASENELLDKSLSFWRGENSSDNEDFCPLPLDIHTAASIGLYDYVNNLIKRGTVNIDSHNPGGWTPLMYASYIGHEKIVKLLIDASANVNAVNKKGQTPLILAACCGNENAAYFLLNNNAEIEIQDKKGWTALFHATYSGHQNMVFFLLKNGANLEARDPNSGFTPFMLAAAEGHEIIVQMFLQNKVNIYGETLNGDSASSLALKYGNIKIVSLIDDYIKFWQHQSSYPEKKELSSSDEAPVFQEDHTKRHGVLRIHHKGPSIQDGPDAFAKIIDQSQSHSASASDNGTPFVPHGYMTFPTTDQDVCLGALRSRDMTSPINAEDHKLNSSSEKDFSDIVCGDGLFLDEDTDDRLHEDPFIKTSAVTIRSGSESSLAKALQLTHKSNIALKTNYLENKSNSESSSSDSLQSSNENLAPLQCFNHVGKETDRLNLKLLQGNQQKSSSINNIDDSQEKIENLSLESKLNQNDNKIYKEHSLRPSVLKETENFKKSVVPPSKNLVSNLVLFPSNPPIEDLQSMLNILGLSKYLKTFDEQDVDLQVFLSLTDNDLKEIGIKLFGPRRKMTNAIARWHSNLLPLLNSTEQCYADRLEAEMQELAIKLHKNSQTVEKLHTDVSQERELRSVTEACLMEDRNSWQQVQHAAETIKANTRKLASSVISARKSLNSLLGSDIDSEDSQAYHHIALDTADICNAVERYGQDIIESANAILKFKNSHDNIRQKIQLSGAKNL